MILLVGREAQNDMDQDPGILSAPKASRKSPSASSVVGGLVVSSSRAGVHLQTSMQEAEVSLGARKGGLGSGRMTVQPPRAVIS